MKYIIYICLSILVLQSCASQKQEGNYLSYAKTSITEHYTNGPIKRLRKKSDYLIDMDKILKDNVKLYQTLFILKAFGYDGYHKFDKNGIRIKRHSLDNITQTVSYDTAKVKSKTGNIYIYIYKHFKEDITQKKQYKQQLPIKKFVFNPYRVHLNNYTYKPYRFEVSKDSTAKKQTKAYRYKLNRKGAIAQEVGLTFWDNDLDGKKDEETIEYIATYNYNDKNQLISKNYEKAGKGTGISSFPDHGLSFSMTNYKPYEEYTYDEVGNLTSVYVYTFQDPTKHSLVFSEEYKYDTNNKLIWLRRRKSNEFMRFNKHIKRTNVFEFNNKQEVVKVISYENDEKTIHATYNLKYLGHDTYDNWTQCYLYLNNSKKPYGESNRILKYYEK